MQAGIDDDDEFEDFSVLDTQMQDLAVIARMDANGNLNLLRNKLVSTATSLQQQVQAATTKMKPLMCQ